MSMMDDSTSDNSPLNLLESSNSKSSVSTLPQFNSQLADKLSRRLRELESENLALKRALPRMADAKGTDCTEWAIKMVDELENEQKKYRESQQNLADLARQHRELRDNAEKNAQQNLKIIAELRQQAEDLERENGELKDQLRDEQSELFKLKQDRGHLAEDQDQDDRSEKSESRRLVDACFEHLDQESPDDGMESGRSSQKASERSSFHPNIVLEMQKIIQNLFEKLQSCATLFGRMQMHIGSTQDTDLLGKIANMKLDLNQSIEMYKKRVKELTSVPNSAESSFHSSEEKEKQNCQKCKLIENERDTLKAQLNNEIMLKDRFMEQANDLERYLREAKRQIEELGGELRISQEKAAEIEQKWQEIKEELKKTAEVKGGGANSSKSTEELNEQIRTLRQRNLALDAKNEDILRAAHRLKEINADELNAKEIELQKQYESIEYQERQYRELEDKFTNGMAKLKTLEEDMQKKDELVKRYMAKIKAFRRLLAQYGHYLDTSIEYETLVERSTQILQDKITDGQRSCSSNSNPTMLNGGVIRPPPQNNKDS